MFVCVCVCMCVCRTYGLPFTGCVHLFVDNGSLKLSHTPCLSSASLSVSSSLRLSVCVCVCVCVCVFACVCVVYICLWDLMENLPKTQMELSDLNPSEGR